MRKKLMTTLALAAALATLVMLGALPTAAAKAATADDTGDIGFYVRALLPENQIDDTLTYFDLRVEPGQTQTLEVEVVNETFEDITVEVAAISASTNRNGVIDYKTPGIRDVSLEHPFSELARLSAPALAVPARGSATARVAITLPRQAYNGVVLGSLVFTRQPAGQPQGTQAMSLQNVYSYVVGVKLSETDTPVEPDFELVNIAGETVNYQPAMVHYIRNKNAAIAKGVELEVTVTDADGKTVAEYHRSGVDMAPNSVMPLAVAPAAQAGAGESQGGEAAPGQLEPGDYTSTIRLGQNGESWSFEEKFTIGTAEANQLNGEAVGNPARAGKGLPFSTVLLILLISAVAVILALFIIIMRMLRRREETKELNRLMRKRREQLELQKRYSRLGQRAMERD